MTRYKYFNVKLPVELWKFLKEKAARNETSMAEIIEKALDEMKKKYDKKYLTNTNV